MSNSNLEVSKANRANEMTELNDLAAQPSSLEQQNLDWMKLIK